MRKLFLIIFIIIIGAFVIRSIWLKRHPPQTQTTVNVSNKIVKFLDKGGRVAWYKGSSHDLIAYDAIADNKTKNTEIYIIRPDGTGKQCVTCNSSVPKGFVGQPEWHPGGNLIIFQAENTNSKHGIYNHISFGIDNDLWLINKDGTNAVKIWSSPPLHAALHPHFNESGTQLIFAERIPTGKSNPSWAKLTPGGENPWDGWQIHIADVDLTKSGTAILSNHRIIQPSGSGFYETHNFHGNNIVYSHTSNGEAYVDDVYEVDESGLGPKNLTNSPTTWEEHGIYSSSGKSMAFISSRADSSWIAPESKAATLKTELFLKNSSGIAQLTQFNKTNSLTRYLISDYDWNREGNQIVFQVAPVLGPAALSPELWMLTFPSAQ